MAFSCGRCVNADFSNVLTVARGARQLQCSLGCRTYTSV
jgi:hypothetical protein